MRAGGPTPACFTRQTNQVARYGHHQRRRGRTSPQGTAPSDRPPYGERRTARVARVQRYKAGVSVGGKSLWIASWDGNGATPRRRVGPPGHSPHRALDALMAGIKQKRVNRVLDADIRGFLCLPDGHRREMAGPGLPGLQRARRRGCRDHRPAPGRSAYPPVRTGVNSPGGRSRIRDQGRIADALPGAVHSWTYQRHRVQAHRHGRGAGAIVAIARSSVAPKVALAPPASQECWAATRHPNAAAVSARGAGSSSA
jgi:hypothetical protein